MTSTTPLRYLIESATQPAPPPARRTGATARIEPMLPEIRELRVEGYTWKKIAAGLTALGLHQVDLETGQSEPLTGRRLSALISAIDKKIARHDARKTARKHRKDLAPAPQGRLQLSPDLSKDGPLSEVRRVATEQDIRASAFQDLQAIMRKDSR